MPPGVLDGFRPRDLDEKGRQEAIAEPGPSWREYFFYEFLKWWIVIGFFILDVLVIASFLVPFQPVIIALALPLAIYVEILAYRYLWYRPEIISVSRRSSFRPTWIRPREYGRWTPENDRAKRGVDPYYGERSVPTGPDAKEFL